MCHLLPDASLMLCGDIEVALDHCIPISFQQKCLQEIAKTSNVCCSKDEVSKLDIVGSAHICWLRMTLLLFIKINYKRGTKNIEIDHRVIVSKYDSKMKKVFRRLDS